MKRVHGTIPAHLAQGAARLRVLEDALRDCIPAECCNHCRVAGIFGGTLVLMVDSPTWSARVRFYASRIISHFHDLGKSEVTQIRTRVGTLATSGIGGPRRDVPLRMPQETAHGFAALAHSTSDPELRQALARLAARAYASDGED